MKAERALEIADCLCAVGKALQEVARQFRDRASTSERLQRFDGRDPEQPSDAVRNGRSSRRSGPATAPALTPEERLTGKQLSAIRVASRRAGVSPEQLAALVAEVSERAEKLEQLSRAEASALLDRLDERTGYAH